MSSFFLWLFLYVAQVSVLGASYMGLGSVPAPGVGYSGLGAAPAPSVGYGGLGGAPGGIAPVAAGLQGGGFGLGAGQSGFGAQTGGEGRDVFADSDQLGPSANDMQIMGAQQNALIQQQRMQARQQAAVSIADVQALVATSYSTKDLWLMSNEAIEKRKASLTEAHRLLSSMRYMRESAANGMYNGGAVPGGVPLPHHMGYGMPGMAYGGYGHVHARNMNVVHDVHVDAGSKALEKKVLAELKRCEEAILRRDVTSLEEDPRLKKELDEIVKEYKSDGLDVKVTASRMRFRRPKVDRGTEDDVQTLRNFIVNFESVLKDLASRHATVKAEYRELLIALKGVTLQYISELTSDVHGEVTGVANDVKGGRGIAQRVSRRVRGRNPAHVLRHKVSMMKQSVKSLEDPMFDSVKNAFSADEETVVEEAEKVATMPQLAWAQSKNKYVGSSFSIHSAEEAREFLKVLPQLMSASDISEESIVNSLQDILSHSDYQKGISLAVYMRAADACAQKRLYKAVHTKMRSGEYPLSVPKEMQKEEEGLSGIFNRTKRRVLKATVGHSARSDAGERRALKFTVEKAITSGAGIDPADPDAMQKSEIDGHFANWLSDQQKEFLTQKALAVFAKWKKVFVPDVDEESPNLVEIIANNVDEVTTSLCSEADCEAIMLAIAAGMHNPQLQEAFTMIVKILYEKRKPALDQMSKGSLRSQVSAIREERAFFTRGVSEANASLTDEG